MIAAHDTTLHHAQLQMADLEKLAIRRDRGYLVRLVLLLVVGGLVSVFLFAWLTGSKTSGCVASTVGGADSADKAPAP
jgi:hypothetical protein